MCVCVNTGVIIRISNEHNNCNMMLFSSLIQEHMVTVIGTHAVLPVTE